MASTTFVNYQTVIDAGWLNDVNSAVYSGTFQASTITPTNVTSSGAISGATVAGTTSVTTPIVKSGTSLSLQTNGSTTAVTIDTAQNVGIGVTPSAGGLSTYKLLEIGTTANGSLYSGSNQMLIGTNIAWSGGTSNYKTSGSYAPCLYNQQNGQHQWSYAASGTAGNAITFTQAMTLDNSNNFLVGTTTNNYTAAKGMVYADSATSPYLAVCHASGATTGSSFEVFSYNGGLIGNISQNGTTGVLYNLTSDYRLKNNPVPVTGAKDFVMALQPKTWDWWDGSGKGVGFIAHEFMEVAKYSGHGEKDAFETIEIKDEDGNVTGTEERPVYQSIQPSSSEVMANLVAYIQELSAEITALKAKVGA